VQNIFGFVINPMEVGLSALSILVASAGLGIILFTVLVRLVLSPLQIAQLRNAKSMQKLQPLMSELKKKHGKDRTVMAEKTKELYREHRVNPAIGCLLTLVQFPILIGLFYALRGLAGSPPTKLGMTCGRTLVKTKGQWIDTCYNIAHVVGTPQQIFDLFHSQFLWLSKGLGATDPLFILPVLAGVTQWTQMRMMAQRSADPQQQMMNSVMNFMPLLIVFFAANYASGLSLYWVTSTLIAILIQYRITGLGLLPETLAKIRGAVATTPRRGAPGPRGMSGGAPKSPPSSKLTQPPSAGAEPNGKRTEPSASDGPTAVVRPRKKANRARGGKQSGRRG
jgi:YidC/Oxa1 family membrane protein insertase